MNHKKYLNQIFFTIFFPMTLNLMPSYSISAMADTLDLTTNSSELLSDTKIPQTILNHIKRIKTGGFIGGSFLQLSDKNIIHELRKAMDRGVKVQIQLDGRHYQKLVKMIDGGNVADIKSTLEDTYGNHQKLWIFSNTNPHNNGNKIINGTLIIGSHNPTEHAKVNKENSLIIETNDTLIQQAFDTTFMNKKIVVPPSQLFTAPVTMIDSNGNHLTSIVRKEITITPTKKFACAMNMNEDELINQLEAAGNSATVIVDKSQYEKSYYGRRAIEKLVFAGCHVYIYCPYNSSSSLLHCKLFHREKTSSHGVFSAVSTGNFTREGNEENNKLILLSGKSDTIHDDIKERFNELLRDCISFNDYVNLSNSGTNKRKKK